MVAKFSVGTCLWHVLYGHLNLRIIHAAARMARSGMSLQIRCLYLLFEYLFAVDNVDA